MIQEERRHRNYEEVMRFVKTNHRNLSKYDFEERRMYTWMKHNRKQMNAGDMKETRQGKFKELLALCEQYKHKNQYS